MSSRYVVISLQKRLFALILAITFFLCAIFAHLFYIQIVSAESLQKKAFSQWFRDLPLSALRGAIYDRNGVVLASSYVTYDVFVRPASVESVENVSAMLSNVLNLDKKEVQQKVSKKISEIKVASQISYADACSLVKNYQKGIYITENSSRQYAFGDFLTQLIGFTNVDGDGQTGLELYYNSFLSGKDGKLVEQTDIKGRSLEDGLSYFVSSISGCSLVTTIDYGLQTFVENLCRTAQANTSAKSVSCVVMNPQNGEVLALGFKPSYDLNNISRDDVAQLMEMSKLVPVTDVYEPGSTFKIITGAIAMELGLTSPSDGFYCGGSRTFGSVKVSCHRKSGHGSQSLTKGYCNSCNCVFMELATRVGVDRFYEYLDKLRLFGGYGSALKNEAVALAMNKPLVQSFDLARMGFGQAFALSPLQLLNSTNAVINGGNLFVPTYVKSIVSASGGNVYSASGAKLAQVFSAKTSENMNRMLEEVVSKGGGKNARVEGLSILGKTGTAQKYENGGIAQGKYVASFIGAYPATSPKYSVLVVVDEPKGAYYGGVVAAPYSKDVFTYIAENMENVDTTQYLESEPTIVMPNLVGKTLTIAVQELTALGLQFLTQGEGDNVTAQLQPENCLLRENDIVLLTLG